MTITKSAIVSASIFTSLLLIITLLFVTNTIDNYNIYRDLRYSFTVLRDPSIQVNGRTYLGRPFIGFTLPDVSGKPYSLYNDKAKLKIILLFNTQDCAGCLDEYRLWKRLDTIYPDDTVSIIGISNNKDTNEVILFIKERNIQFPILLDQDNFIKKSMGFRFSPLRIIVNNHNIISDIAVAGSNLAQQKVFQSYVASLLEKQKE